MELSAQADISQIYDVLIIGGGPAGVAAAIYTARKKLKTLLVTESFGGQSIVASDIQNWVGEPHISGIDLAKKMETHVRNFPEMIDIKSPEEAISVKTVQCLESKRFCDFQVTTDKGKYVSKTIIVASGARRRKLGVPGEDQFQSRGVSYCSTCDAPLFKDKNVAVVGGGNAGLEAVLDLFQYASEIYIVERGEQLRADPSTIEEIKVNPKLKEIFLNSQVLEINGETLVTNLKLRDTKTSEERVLEVGGVFIEIGSIPNSEIVKDLVQLDPHRQIMINFKFATTSHPGVFAAGDVTDDPFKQNNISAGDGVRAALAAYNYLLNKQKQSPAEEKHE